MRIAIAERLRPFSHTPGTRVVLPGTSFVLQIFPTRIEVFDFLGPHALLMNSYDLKLTGPVKDFTVQLDLEKGMIHVWGHYQEGYVRYHVLPSGTLRFEKGPLLSQEAIELTSRPALKMAVNEERLSLGSHRAQDWDLATRRCDLSEIFPFWFRLGQYVSSASEDRVGTLALLDRCKGSDKLEVLQHFENLFRAGFDGILAPRLTDEGYQGFGVSVPSKNCKASPLSLLSEGAAVIRSLFFQSDGREVRILPILPPQFHCGRFLNVISEAGIFDLEWSKKTIRRMIFKAAKSGEFICTFQKHVKSYRLRTSARDKGRRILTSEPIQIESGATYLFDNFQK